MEEPVMDSVDRRVASLLYDAFDRAYPRVLPDDWGDDEQEDEQ